MTNEVFHTIKGKLHDNPLTTNPNDLLARVESEGSLDIADICQKAATRGGADISASAMEHAASLFLKEMGYNLCDGFSINTGWFTASPVIRGTFDSPSDAFDPTRHRLLFEFQQGAELRKELALATVEIRGMAESGFYIAQVTDVKSGTVNDLLTPGRNLKIAGQRIKVSGESEDNGVYFVSDSGERTKVEASDIVVNNPSEVMVIIPDLGAGAYKVEITTQYSSGKELKTPHAALFDRVLTVQ